jgi:hypothetical protein
MREDHLAHMQSQADDYEQRLGDLQLSHQQSAQGDSASIAVVADSSLLQHNGQSTGAPPYVVDPSVDPAPTTSRYGSTHGSGMTLARHLLHSTSDGTTTPPPGAVYHNPSGDPAMQPEPTRRGAQPPLSPRNVAPIRTQPKTSASAQKSHYQLDINPDLEELNLPNPFPCVTGYLNLLRIKARELIEQADQLRSYSKTQESPKKDPNNPKTPQEYQEIQEQWDLLQTVITRNGGQLLELAALMNAIDQGAPRLIRGTNPDNMRLLRQLRKEADTARLSTTVPPVAQPVATITPQQAAAIQANAAARTLLQTIAAAAQVPLSPGPPPSAIVVAPPLLQPAQFQPVGPPAFCPAQTAYLAGLGIANNVILGIPAPHPPPPAHPGTNLFPTMAPAATASVISTGTLAGLTAQQLAYLTACATPSPAGATPVAAVQAATPTPPIPPLAPTAMPVSFAPPTSSDGRAVPLDQYLASLSMKLPPRKGAPATPDEQIQRDRIEGCIGYYRREPRTFCNDASDSMAEWTAQLLEHMIAMGIEEDIDRVRCLTDHLSGDLRNQVRKAIPLKDQQTWKPHLEYMLTTFLRNDTTERAQDKSNFERKRQEPHESLGMFLQDLKKLRAHGFPGDRPEIPFDTNLNTGDQAIQDAFIAHMTKDVLRDHLNIHYITSAKINKKDIQELERYAVAMEPILSGATSLTNPQAIKALIEERIASISVAAVTPYHPGPPQLPTYGQTARPNFPPRPNYPEATTTPPPRPAPVGRNPRIDPCWLCGLFGHLSYTCPTRPNGPIAAPQRNVGRTPADYGQRVTTGDETLDRLNMNQLRTEVRRLKAALLAAQAIQDAPTIAALQEQASATVLAIRVLWAEDDHQAGGLLAGEESF